MTLKEQVTRVNKQFGAGALIRMGDTEHVPVKVISTGIPALDAATGVGGFPRGRIIEIFGQEAVGKTSISMSVIAEAQKAGELCAIVDAEHAVDRDHAAKLGVLVDDLYISQPSCGEEALEIAEALVKSGEIAVVVVDSVAALVPRAELEGEMGDAQMGLQARLMSQALRKLTALVHKSNCVFIMINQMRDRIGVVYGNPATTTGGKALKFYSGMRLEVSKSGAIKDGDDVIGAKTKVKIIKNKVSAPSKVAEFDLLYDRGFSRSSGIFDLAVESGIIAKSGAWLTYTDNRWQGRNNAIEFLDANPAILEKIEEELNGAA
jgi:recombination protein RecA